MTAAAPSPVPELTSSLADRAAGRSVIEELLRVQSTVHPRSRLMRVLGQTPLSAQSRPWYVGALGEIEVGRLLSRLGPEWHVLHAVPVGERDADIDHVVLGPGGVFTLNTKHHPGQSVWVAGRAVRVAGQAQPYVRNAEHEAQRAAKLLSAAWGRPVPVAPLVVVVGAQRVMVKEEPEQVRFLPSDRLLRFLTRSRPVLAEAEVQELLAIAGRPSTWRRAPGSSADQPALLERFRVLDAAVRRARLVRTLWPLSGCALVAVGGLTVGPELVTGLLL